MEWNIRKYAKIFLQAIITIFLATIIMISFLPININFAKAQGSASIVMEQGTQKVLKGNNINVRLPMASTTKIITAMIVLENAKLDDIVTIKKEAVGVEGSSIYIKEGQKYSVEELLYGLMLRSGNDASVALAVHVSGSVDDFVKLMNDKVKKLNLSNTNFCNPHGLHDENHYSTAYDMAVLTCEAMKNPIFREIVSTKKVDIGSEEMETNQILYNKNKFLTNYEYGNGVKTGYTKNSGRCLVASATKCDTTLVSVAINIYDTYGTCKQLIDYGFECLHF